MRIVSLCPSITETLVDFELTAELVGVTRFCIHPRAVTRALVKVGGTKTPDLEAIARLEPDLVFVNEEENTKAAFDFLAARFRVDASFPRRVREVPALLRHFGALTGRVARAEVRAAELEALLSRPGTGKVARVAYLIWKNPWMAAGGDTYVSDLLADAGATNVFAELPDRYPTVTLESLGAAAPDLVLLPDEPYRFRERDQRELEAAVPGIRFALVSGDDCSWHGVRTLRGVALARRLVGAL